MAQTVVLSAFSVLMCFGAEEFAASGRVVDGASGEPLKNAMVTIQCYRPALYRAVLTDHSGSFRFEGLAGLRCTLNGRKPAYEDATEVVQPGPSRENIVLSLKRLGVIRGRVSTTERESFIGASVQLWRQELRRGRRQFTRISFTTTDDRGEYLLADVSPGVYVLHLPGRSGVTVPLVGSLPPRMDEEESFSPVFYGGGSSLPGAATLQMESGRELRADFSISMRPAYPLTGSLSKLTPYVPVTLLLLTPDLTAVHCRSALNSATGEFRMVDVPTGSYILRATQQDGQRFTTAEVPVLVTNGPVRNIRMALGTGVDIPLTVQGGSDPGRPVARLELARITPISGGIYSAWAVAGKGAKFENLAPGRYRFAISSSNACVQTVTAGSQNLLSTPEISVVDGVQPAQIEMVVAGQCGAVEAVLPPASSRDAATALVLVLLPAVGGEPLAVLGGPEQDGFAAHNVLPGEYTAFLCKSDFAYAEPDVRDRSRIRGQQIRVDPGGTTKIQLEALP